MNSRTSKRLIYRLVPVAEANSMYITRINSPDGGTGTYMDAPFMSSNKILQPL